ncbi:DNA alkylation repair protein [Candidatus Pacearchaeota archaeon CG_4_9_14_3_um_filter_31_7]|nr:MAG: DNA alkylation repair protein [Candidatus Pacearchaeota archaeon CG1_02_31_27]PIN91912.1 MAG: DNA alkylation repair protein [Candidatus Pacearchaeota archaeon CG10_big_fil_rev_8_21_14_0_10_31_59]PIZ80471.1 MAG: DNA alkylation repair protein [Candidatus Pacearchaeota archaeon CG_4_10_14_0_2_um_filter_31_10]PJA70776.1 MAG: DNA alkylation repair protein [Candidatus Pacearchaeota archaeon CG_4_9_14_3_um_filter_31_7]
MLSQLKKELESLADSEKAKVYQRFFKTAKGEYGEGDVFLGLKVPKLREIAKKYYCLDLRQLKELMDSSIHEHRMIALFILIKKYNKSNETNKRKIFKLYIKNIKNINNWDLVDLNAPNIVGTHLINKDRKILYDFAKSDNLWKKRISVLACFAFIKNKDFKDTLKISEILLKDKHDLIHKAVGWMLREIGKRDLTTLETFLKKHYKSMPRTMLRYSLEKLPEEKRNFYMGK